MPPRARSAPAIRPHLTAIQRAAEARAARTLEALVRNMRRRQAAARTAAREASENAANRARTFAGQRLRQQRSARAAVLRQRRAASSVQANIRNLRSIIGQFHNTSSLNHALRRHTLHNNPYGMGTSRHVPNNLRNRVKAYYTLKEQHNRNLQHAQMVHRAASEMRARSAAAITRLSRMRF